MIVNERFIITFDIQKEADAIAQFEKANAELNEKWIADFGTVAISYRKENTYYVEFAESENKTDV